MPPVEHRDIVIVGAGHAGVQTAVNLVKMADVGSIALLSAEKHLPYERPPLTKRQLYGPGENTPLPLRSAEYWSRTSIDLRLGERVVDVDAERRLVTTPSGRSISYGSLVWAAGGSAAQPALPGEDLQGVHTIRDFDDLIALKSDLPEARSAAIVGGGYIGLEVAAALNNIGLAVTVVEMAPRLLARVTGAIVSDFFTDLHRERGVDVRLGVGVVSILGQAGSATGLQLTDGDRVQADIIVIGVGMRPNVSPLLNAGAKGDIAGVTVDMLCRTSLPHIFAIGDCVTQNNPWSASPSPVRVESVHNAAIHAGVVTSVLSGSMKTASPAPPRFWSTQYGNELKTVGMPHPSDISIVRGEPSQSDFSVIYLRDGAMAAIDTVNRVRDFGRAQSLIAARWHPTELDLLSDPGTEFPRIDALRPNSAV